MLGVDAGELRSAVFFQKRLDLGRESGTPLFTEDCPDFFQRQFLLGSGCGGLQLCIDSRLVLQHGIRHSLNAVRQGEKLLDHIKQELDLIREFINYSCGIIPFNFAIPFNYSKITTPQGLHPKVPPDFGTTEIHN